MIDRNRIRNIVAECVREAVESNPGNGNPFKAKNQNVSPMQARWDSAPNPLNSAPKDDEVIKNESLRRLVRSAVNEGIFGLPDTIDQIMLDTMNDRECMERFMSIVRALMKHVKRGEQLSIDTLSRSEIMRKFQQFCFRKFRIMQKDINPNRSPAIFRREMADKIIQQVEEELWNEQNN